MNNWILLSITILSTGWGGSWRRNEYEKKQNE